MSDRPDTVSSGPDSPMIEEPDSPMMEGPTQSKDQQQDTGDIIQRDEFAAAPLAAPPVNSAMGMLQDTTRAVQGMMAMMGQGGGPATTTAGEPMVQSATTFQSSTVGPDGTVTTNIGTDPSGDARSATSYDPTTNTLTTTTVDPSTGSITTTSTTVPVTGAGTDASEDRNDA